MLQKFLKAIDSHAKGLSSIVLGSILILNTIGLSALNIIVLIIGATFMWDGIVQAQLIEKSKKFFSAKNKK